MLTPLLAAFTLATQPQDSCASSSVPAVAPDSVAAAVYQRLFADSTRISLLPRRSDRQPRNVILVTFRADATAKQRRAALHTVCGRLVGGWQVGGSGGYFVVEVTTDGSAAGLWSVIDRLAAQPGVASAQPGLPDLVPAPG